MLFGLGMPELVVILLVVLVIFGPKNLPKLGKQLGKTAKSIREGMDEVEAESKGETAEAADVVVEKVESEDADAPVAAASSSEKFCGKCGAKNPADNKFCCECGEKLS